MPSKRKTGTTPDRVFARFCRRCGMGFRNKRVKFSKGDGEVLTCPETGCDIRYRAGKLSRRQAGATTVELLDDPNRRTIGGRPIFPRRINRA